MADSIIPPVDIVPQFSARPEGVDSNPVLNRNDAEYAAFLREINDTYNPPVTPINSSVNHYVTGNTLTGPSQNDASYNAVNALKAKIDSADQWANSTFTYSGPFEYGAGWRNMNFERYYSKPEFRKLGYFPGIDNEAVYNKHTGFISDMARAVPQMAKLMIAGASDMASEWTSFGGPNNPDLAMADEMIHRMAVGSSSREGLGGWVTNFGVNMGYTLGIMGEMWAEEMALAGITALTGGATSSLMVERAAKGAERLSTVEDVAKQTSKFKSSLETLRGMDSIDKARALREGRNVLSFINPFENTANLVRDYDKLKDLTDWGKTFKTASALYRDARIINAVVSESKLEGGMRKLEQSDELLNDFYNKYNRLPQSDEEIRSLNQKASDAAYWTTLANMPMIFLTDKIVFDKAFKGANILRAPEEVGKNILKGSGKKILLEATGTAPKVVKTFSKEGLKMAFNPKSILKGTLRYTGANVAEGIQETSQDIIQESIKDYYSQTYKDPANASMLASLGLGIGSQLSAQGVSTFFSGFLMGGVLQGGQTLLFDKAMTFGKKIFDKEGYKNWQKNVDDYVNNFTNTYQDIAKNPAKYESALRGIDSMFVATKELGNQIEELSEKGTVHSVLNTQDEMAFKSLIGFIQSGHQDHLFNLVEHWKGMTDEQIAEAWGVSPDKDEAGMTPKKRVQVFEKRLSQAYAVWTKSFNTLVNPIDLEQAKLSNDTDQQLRYYAFEKYRELATFHLYAFERALDRQDSIYNQIITDPKLGGIPSSQFSHLLSPDSLSSQVTILKGEIKSLEALNDPTSKRLLKEKNKELELYERYQKNLDGYRQAHDAYYAMGFFKTSDEESLRVFEEHRNGIYDQATTFLSELRDSYKNVIKELAKRQGINTLNVSLNDSFDLVYDHLMLGFDKDTMAEVVNILTTPKHLTELTQRLIPSVLTEIEANKLDYYKEGLQKFFGKVALDSLIKELNKIGVVLPARELDRILKGAEPSQFIDRALNKTIDTSTEKGAKALEIVKKYLEAVSTKAKEEATVVKKEVPKAPEVVVAKPISKTTPIAEMPAVLKESLEKALETVNAKRKADNEPIFGDIEDFIENSAEAVNIINQYNIDNKLVAKPVTEAPVTPPAAAAEVTPTQQPPTAPVSDKKADIVQTYEYKGRTQTIKKEVSTKDGVTKVTFTGERSDKPGVSIKSGYVYGSVASNSVQQFFDDYGVILEDIAEDLSINDIKSIQVIEERTSKGKTAITFRITYSEEMGGMSSERMEMTVKKQKFTSEAELAALEGGKPETTFTGPAILPKYAGSIIYATPGIGKSLLASLRPDIIDGDQVLVDIMTAAGYTNVTIDNIGDRIGEEFEKEFAEAEKTGFSWVKSTSPMENVYDQAFARMQEYAGKGYTVLTGSTRFIPVVNHVIVSATDQGIIDKYGKEKAELIRSREDAKITESRVSYTTLEEGQSLEQKLTQKPEKGTIDIDAELAKVETLSQLQKLEDRVAQELDVVSEDLVKRFEAKAAQLSKSVTFNSVEVGNYLVTKGVISKGKQTLEAGNIVEVVSKGPRSIKVREFNPAAPRKNKLEYSISKKAFDESILSIADPTASEIKIDPASEQEAKNNASNTFQGDKPIDINALRKKNKKNKEEGKDPEKPDPNCT